MAVIGPRFMIKGIEPAEVRRAPTAQRRAFWQAASAFIAEAKESELKQGLDKDGNPMVALAQYTIEHRESEMGPADPFAPPLQPAHGLSRTRSLFMAQPTSALDGVTCWWAYDALTGESWGKMLAIHRAGGPRLPRRDVIGLSSFSLATVKQRAESWWTAYVHGLATVPEAQREILPEPEPKFMVETRKARKPVEPKNKQRTSQIKINGHVYTLQSGSAAQIRRAIANKTFSGFRGEAGRLEEMARAGVSRGPGGRYTFSTPPPIGTKLSIPAARPTADQWSGAKLATSGRQYLKPSDTWNPGK